MISVIVPVYRVESYLEKCLDSITGQTYTDLEILLIDDGSPDRCGEICDRYAAVDHRIQVFHTENHGLSAARNLGLEHAEGDYIGFVDSDDWIEANMYECLLRAVKENDADIGVCGRFMEYPKKTEIISPSLGVFIQKQAVEALARLEIRNAVWDKIWKRECFTDIRFPDGRVYEDSATTYRFFLQAEKVVCISETLYHYRIRTDSISHDGQLNHLIDYFKSTKDEYEAFAYNAPFMNNEICRILSSHFGTVIRELWSNYFSNTREERNKFRYELHSISQYIKENYSAFSPEEWPVIRRLFLFLGRYDVWWSFAVAWIVARIRKSLSLKSLF